MNTQPSRESMNSLLREVAADDEAGQGASLEVQARLLYEVRAIGARRRRRLFTAVMLTAVAASLLGVLFVSHRTGSLPADAVSPKPQLREMATAFLPLAGATAPAAGAYLVRLEVPRTALVRLGLGQAETLVSSTALTSTVLADVLVGDDGVARAVRFVHQE